MKTAARAIIIVDKHLLLMKRVVENNTYYTLVGGAVADGETPQQALIREVKEESQLDVISSRLVFTEYSPDPVASQYIFLCEVATSTAIGIDPRSEESIRNEIGLDLHELTWLKQDMFAKIPFRTPRLQTAIIKALRQGFPDEPTQLY